MNEKLPPELKLLAFETSGAAGCVRCQAVIASTGEHIEAIGRTVAIALRRVIKKSMATVH